MFSKILTNTFATEYSVISFHLRSAGRKTLNCLKVFDFFVLLLNDENAIN